MASEERILKNYEYAKEEFASWGVDTEKALDKFDTITMSMHCWQGDDIKGFEPVGDIGSQNVVTGNYPGAARNGDELRGDIDFALSMSPFQHKVNIHSCYGEFGRDRKDVTVEDFSKWIAWAKEKGYGIDFNGSFFAHKMMNNGFSYASLDKATRDYWIETAKGTREISYAIGKELGQTCYNNLWIPDGLKDTPANRFRYRDVLNNALDEIFSKRYEGNHFIDTLEGKLFGIGVESFTVGSHEFYLGYAASHRGQGIGVCLDTGHYHPTEKVEDKLSAVVPFVDHVLLHISRGIRWDSDHIVVQSDELTGIMTEMNRGDLFGKVGMGLDYFDASINRIAAWTIGMRAAAKSVLTALLEPFAYIDQAEMEGDFTSRLAYMDEFKNLPYNAVWEYMLMKKGIADGRTALANIKQYEKDVLSLR